MPRRDLYHDTVRNALIKDGWTITHDPLILGDQYVLYRSILRRSGSIREPYLAIPLRVYRELFQKAIVQNLIEDENIHLIVFNPDLEVIEQWID